MVIQIKLLNTTTSMVYQKLTKKTEKPYALLIMDSVCYNTKNYKYDCEFLIVNGLYNCNYLVYIINL